MTKRLDPEVVNKYKRQQDELDYQLGVLLRDKEVALVGGADSVCPSFERYDIIARVNHHFERQGGGVDILYTRAGLPGYFSRFKHVLELKRLPKFIIWEERKSNLARQFLGRSMVFNRIIYAPFGGAGAKKQHQCQPLVREAGVNYPLTGMIAVNHLLKYKFKKLFITGMDFYVSAEERDGLEGHSVTRHFNWLIAKIEQDERIHFDMTIADLLLQAAKYPGEDILAPRLT